MEEKRKKEGERVPLVNLTDVVVIMRKTDNTWAHVERITIELKHTRAQEHKLPVTNTSSTHMQYEIQPI